MRLLLTDVPTNRVGSRRARRSRGCGAGNAYRAVLLRGRGADGGGSGAQRCGCSQASVYAWTAAWRQDGVAGLREGDHGGGTSQAGRGRGGVLQVACWRPIPKRTAIRPRAGRCRCCRANWRRSGYAVGERTVRRALHRLGLSLETAAVRAGTSRSGLCRKKGAVIAQATAMLAAGGEVWVADETALREFPPLRAGWSKRGDTGAWCSSAARTPAAPSSGPST